MSSSLPILILIAIYLLTSIVTMPKATVDKDARAILPQHNIRMTRQARIIQPITKTMLPQIMTHNVH